MNKTLAASTLALMVLALAWLVYSPSAQAAACACSTEQIEYAPTACDAFCVNEGGCGPFLGYFKVYDANNICVAMDMRYNCNYTDSTVIFTYRCYAGGGGGGGGGGSPIFKKDLYDWYPPSP